jgi:hypothetical protein
MASMQEVDCLRGTRMKRGSHQMRTKPTFAYKVYEFIIYKKIYIYMILMRQNKGGLN